MSPASSPTLLPATRRRGVVAVLAMIYLILFSTLAVGFYAATTISAQVSHNEVTAGRALLAAETGFEFVRHHLGRVNIDPSTPPDQLFQSVADQLGAALDGTGNLGGGSIAVSGNQIRIPAAPADFITANANGASAFQVLLEASGEQLEARIIGRDRDTLATSGRGIRMGFALARNASSIFDFGVASRGSISANGNVRIQGAQHPSQGSLLAASSTSAVPVELIGNPSVSGDISITNPAGSVSLTGNPSVGGTTNQALIFQDHVHTGVAQPEFPTVDTDAFVAHVTSSYAGGNTLVNVRIPPHTNPTINGNTTIQGVLYIQAPNRVRFNGNTTIQGVIVTDNDPAGNLSTNTLTFSGNVTSQGVETLPASFGSLRDLTGAFLLAPNFHASFTGNFGTVNGSIIAGRIGMSGNAGGTVLGTVLSLTDTPLILSGNSNITISSTGTTNYPAGVTFSSHYAPLPDTYEEFIP